MKKKLLALLAVLTLVVCMFASCGECDEHVDADKDYICDECEAELEKPKPETPDTPTPDDPTPDDPTPDDPTPDTPVVPEPDEHECVDENGDFVCDDPECGEPVIPETPDRTGKTYTWEEATLKAQLNLHSSSNELAAQTKRYMAGAESKGTKIDDMVADRNLDALTTTGIIMDFEYIPDAEKWLGSEQGWGAYFKNAIATELAAYIEGETADMYCGFAYDLTMASALGYFHNLMATKIDGTDVQNYFTFLLDDYRPQFDDEGYLYDFMTSLSPIPETKMYLYASNFTLDVIRSIYCIPVSISLLNSLDVAELPAGSDINGNGKYEINEFYTMVRNMGWTYDMLANLSAAVFNPTSGATDANLQDTLGFALDTSMGLPSAGVTYSIDFNWYEMEVIEGTNTYKVAADSTNLEAMMTAWEQLFSKDGVIMTDNTKSNTELGISKAVMGIRQQFSLDKMLFGGVVLIGALDYDDYQNMENGFGIAPIPLYAVKENAAYTSAIHNLARVVGISCKISAARFSQATAYLDFQAINSDEIMNQYYKSLQYDTVGGEEYNIEILDYLRDHIRNNRDQYIENMICNSAVIPNSNLKAEHKFGQFFRAGKGVDSTNVRDKYEATKELKAAALKSLVAMFEALP